MGRNKNDGFGRFGGRQKGTPNKVNSELKEWITQILNDGKDQFIVDLKDLKPSERIRVYTGLLNYVLPKQQAIMAEFESDGGKPNGLTIIVEKKEDEDLIRQALAK